MNFHQHQKNQTISLTCSGDMVDWKILKSDWLKTFWPISQEQRFSIIWDLCKNTANDIKNIREQTQKKLMIKFFNKFKKQFLAHFWSIFPILRAQTDDNNTIPRKCSDRRKDGRKDRSYIIGPFRLPPGVQ